MRAEIWAIQCLGGYLKLSTPVVLRNMLTGAVYHRLMMHDLPALLEYVLTFCELWTGSGSRAIGLHYLPTSVLWSFGCGDTRKTFMLSAPITGLEVLQLAVQNACQETRVKPGIRETAHLCATELKAVLKSRESAVEITGILLLSQQTLVSGHTLTETFLLLKRISYPP